MSQFSHNIEVYLKRGRHYVQYLFTKYYSLLCISNKCFCCDLQLNRLQDQVTSLKTSNEHLQKQNDDMINTLKEVCSHILYIE